MTTNQPSISSQENFRLKSAPNYKKFADFYVKYHSPFPKEYRVGPWATAGPAEFAKSLNGKTKNEMIWMIDIRDQVLGTMTELIVNPKKKPRAKKGQ